MSVSSLTVRLATAADAPTIFSLIQALAEYEQLAHEVVGSAAAIATHSSGDRPYITTLLAEVDQVPVGLALFFQTYSTQAAAPGYYLEDLFVLPQHRRQGIGKALLIALAKHTLDQGFRELRWSVLNWNESAIAFYRRIGANISDQIRICRTTGSGLKTLASSQLDFEALNPDIQASTQEAIAWNLVPPSRVSELTHTLKIWEEHPAATPSTRTLGQQIDDLVAHGTTHTPRFEILQITQQEQPLGCALLTSSYSTFLTQPGILVEGIAHAPHLPPLAAQRALWRSLAELTLERQRGRLEWYIDADAADATGSIAIASAQQQGITILPDWRICCLDHQAVTHLAHGST